RRRAPGQCAGCRRGRGGRARSALPRLHRARLPALVIPAKLIEDTARELMARAAIDIPADYRAGVAAAREREQNRLARFVLTEMERNWDIATADRRPMCADTGLP